MIPHEEEGVSDWRRAQILLASGDAFEGTVVAHNARGLVVRFGSLRGFIPMAEITTRALEELLSVHRRSSDAGRWLSGLVGQRLQLRVMEVDQFRRRLIFSERKARGSEIR